MYVRISQQAMADAQRPLDFAMLKKKLADRKYGTETDGGETCGALFTLRLCAPVPGFAAL